MENVASLPAGRPGHVRWNILAILVAMSFIAYVLRANMSIAGDGMMKDTGLTAIEFGMVLAAANWSYALFQIPGGIFGDIVGPRRALTWITVGWGVATLAIGLVPGTAGTGVVLVWLIALRFLTGALQAPIFPVYAGAVRNWFPANQWALPNALGSTGLNLGWAAAAPLIAWLTLTFGWRESFIMTAPLGFAIGLLWWWYGRDFPDQHPHVGAAELGFIQSGREERVAEEPGAWKRALRDRNVLLLTLSYFSMNYVFYIFFNWFFIYLVQVRGLASLEGGVLAMIPTLVGAVAATVGGFWCDAASRARGIRHGCRLPALICLPMVAVLLWAGAAAEDAWLAVALLALCFGGTQMTEGGYWSAITAVAGRHTAAASGLMNTGANVVGGFGALLVPFVAERVGWIAALSTGSVMAIIAAVLWLFIRPDQQIGQ
jgi:ACS family glucarate transporter-like MFS transporter